MVRGIREDDEDDASSCSNGTDASDREALKAFAKVMYAELNPTEWNPSMDHSNDPPPERQSILNTLRASILGETTTTRRRPSMFGRDDTTTQRRMTVRRISVAAMAIPMKVRRIIKNKVRFTEPLHQCEYIESVRDFDKELIDAIWFTGDEMDDMRADARALAAAIDAGYTDVDIRGLEKKTEEGNWYLYQARQHNTNAVLDEQDRQQDRMFATPDPVAIAQASLEVTERYAHEARERGRQDALVAANIHEEK